MIKKIDCPIFNLHISYLPYNRGAHPNFWSFYDNTPSGVTIHLIDEGIDTGPIIYQKYINFNIDEKTFILTYFRLIKEIEDLFISNTYKLISNEWIAKPQCGNGTHHFKKDLPINFSGWDSKISNEIKKLHKEGLLYDE
jgi:methionyl-tRNA formyltransferase